MTPQDLLVRFQLVVWRELFCPLLIWNLLLYIAYSASSCVFQKYIVVVLVMSSMTKEELKNALISHGAPVPPASAKKDEFIQVIGAAYELKIEKD